MERNFKKALDFVLRWEGEYSNNPSDPGGETKYGISKKAYPGLDVSSLTLEKATEIYQRDYWGPIGGDDLKEGFDVAAFDSAVNCGVRITLAWLSKSSSAMDLIMYRLSHYINLNKPMFLRGWVNRLLALWGEVR